MTLNVSLVLEGSVLVIDNEYGSFSLDRDEAMQLLELLPDKIAQMQGDNREKKGAD